MKLLFTIWLLLLLFSCSKVNKEIVAEVDDESILLSDLSEASKQELFDLLNMAYEIKSRVLDDLIKKKLLEKAANKQNMTIYQYLESYVDMKISANIDTVMTPNTLVTNHVSVMRGQLHSSFQESMEGELVLKNKLRSNIIQQLVDSLYRRAIVKKYLFPPRQPKCVITDLCIHYRGNLNAPVSFIVASDFNCERCVTFESTLQRIYDKYKDRVKFGFVSFGDFPTLPALACEAAARQDKFWDFHDYIFAHKGFVDSTFIFNLAKNKCLDITQFKKDLHSPENYKKLDKTINDLVNRGVFATPTIIVNDRLVYMTNSYEELSRLLEYELK